MPPGLPSSLVMWVGLAVLMLIWQFFGGIFTEWGKRWVRGKNNPDERRRETDMNEAWLHEFVDAQKQAATDNATVMGEIRNLANAIEKMATGMKERGESAFEQHGDIISEIRKLDVPRRPERRQHMGG